MLGIRDDAASAHGHVANHRFANEEAVRRNVLNGSTDCCITVDANADKSHDRAGGRAGRSTIGETCPEWVGSLFRPDQWSDTEAVVSLRAMRAAAA